MPEAEVNVASLPTRLYWWKLPWGRTHIVENCVTAFMENPGRWGVDRMHGGRLRRAQRDRRDLCKECGERFVRARLVGHAALEQHAAAKRESREREPGTRRARREARR